MLGRKIRQKAEQGTPVLDAFTEFIAARKAANVAQSTITYYRGKLHPFCEWCGENGAPPTSDITQRHLCNYILTLKKRGLSPWIMHGAAPAIKAFLRFCHAEGMIADVPAVAMPKLPKELPQPFSAKEVKRLIASCECERDRAIVLFLLDTGLRGNELIALDGKDFDVLTGTVFVRDGKGGENRVVFIGNQAKAAILRYCREANSKPGKGDPVWVARIEPFGRLSFWGFSSMLRRLGGRAEVPTCTPHRFRWIFAVWAIRAGMDVFTLQRLMGHADLATTRRYVALVDDDMRESHRRYGAVDSNL